MARTPVVVRIDLERVICHDEGDGIGSAEPYLWVAFFKVDGTTVSVNSAFTLDGVATVEFTPGSHGNLPNDDVDPGEVIAIPPAIGDWSTRLEPIGFQEVPDLDVGRTRSRRLRIDARRAADALAGERFRRADGIHDVLTGLAADPPSRRYPGTTTTPPDTTARR